MRSIEINLGYSIPKETRRFTYKHNTNSVVVVKYTDKPHGYTCYNYKNRGFGSFEITKIKSFDGEIRLHNVLPISEVIDFFVYYSDSLNKPLLICIAVMHNKAFVKYRYFCPRIKDSNDWEEVHDLTQDPKRYHNMEFLKAKLDKTFELMGGVEIHIDKKEKYTLKNMTITPEYHDLGDYDVHTHEIETESEFTLTRLRIGGEIIRGIQIEAPVLSVHVFTHKKHYDRKPIGVCIVEYSEKASDANIHKWYSPSDKTFLNWELRLVEDGLYSEDYAKSCLDDFCVIFNTFHIDIDTAFLYSEPTVYKNENGVHYQIKKLETKYGFSHHVWELVSIRNFGIESFKIHGVEQLGLPTSAYGKFHVFCNERNDSHVPVILCFEVGKDVFRWFQPEDFGSNCWIKCNTDGIDPYGDISSHLDKIYSELFWVDLDIKYENATNLMHLSRHSRFIGTKVNKFNGYTIVEVANKSPYPLNMDIVENGVLQKGIQDLQDVDTIHIVYFHEGFKKEPIFISVLYKYVYRDTIWYVRAGERSNYWSIESSMNGIDPEFFSLRMFSKLQNKYYEFEYKNRYNGDTEYTDHSSHTGIRSLTAKAIGSSVGAAACCGTGYLVYTNAGSILAFFKGL